jgi:signal transduction histidine kinase
MNPHTPIQRSRLYLFLAVSYAFWAAVGLRWITEFIEQGHPLTWLISGMLALYGVLLGLGSVIGGASALRAHLYLAFQSALVFAASLLYYELDFFAILLVPLCGQANYLFDRRNANFWTAVLVLITFVGQMIQFGWPGVLSFALLYSAAIIFMAAFMRITVQAEAARRRSQALLTELQAAHRQLQAYAGQAEELAVEKERTRLARDLHDSVAQTLYGLTLQCEAALRNLEAGQQAPVAAALREIRAGAQQTLKETRLLIFELRPQILDEQGLVAALRARLEAVERRSGLRVALDLDETGRLLAPVETGFYRIAQEALNNLLKHSGACQVVVRLAREQGVVRMEIQDDGSGFDPDAAASQGGLGLEGMRGRAQEIGARLWIESSPGSGTRVTVEADI